MLTDTNHKRYKLAAILFLIFNHAMSASATPLATSEITMGTLFFILVLSVLAIISFMYWLKKQKSPIHVVGLSYNKELHKIELTVKNSSQERYCIKSALRMIQPANEVLKAVQSEGNIPMSQARASIGSRQLFQLLCEDESPVFLDANEQRTLGYDIATPAHLISLDDSKNVEVHISYGEDNIGRNHTLKGSSQKGGDESLEQAQAQDHKEQTHIDCVDASQASPVTFPFLLEDLLESLENSSDEAVVFHMEDGNEIAEWVRSVVGDSELAQALDGIGQKDTKTIRQQSIQLIDAKIESNKHPYLRKVQDSFILKDQFENKLGEVSHLEDLADTLERTSNDAISFHLRGGNDFANWIQAAVGDTELAGRIQNVSQKDPVVTKNIMVSAIRERVDSLKS